MRSRTQLKNMKPGDRVWSEMIDSLWRQYPALYNEKYKSDESWLRNEFSDLIDFGQALGQANKIEGNRSTSIGQGNNTKAFMELLLGAFATIAIDQDPDNWVVTDRLEELGNGTDADNRSFARRTYKSGYTVFGNALKLGEYSNGANLPESGTLQYNSATGFQGYRNANWNKFAMIDAGATTNQFAYYDSLTDKLKTRAIAIADVTSLQTTLDGKAPTTVYPATGLTTGYLPYKSASVLANGPIYTNGTGIAIGTTTVDSKISLAASTSSSGGISFGTDLHLYRIAAGNLITDGTFICSGFTSYGNLDLTNHNIVRTAILYFGNANDASLYRYAAGELKTVSSLDAASYKIGGVSTFLDWSRTGYAGTAGQILVSQGISTTPIWTTVAYEPTITKSTGFLKWTGSAWSFDSSTYLTAITKSMVESVLTGAITTHSHAVSYIALSDTSDTAYTGKNMFVPSVNESTSQLDLIETIELTGFTGTIPAGSTLVVENGIIKSYS